MIRTKHFALSWGYNVGTDTRYGLTIALGNRPKTDPFVPGNCEKASSYGPRYRVVLSLWFDWPQFRWLDETWAFNEPGYIKGMPVPRRGIRSSAWTGRGLMLAGVDWQRGWSFHRYE